MYYIHDLDILLTMFTDDPLSMMRRIWCTSLGGEEYSDIFLIWIERMLYCEDIFFYDVLRFCIDRYDDDMAEIFGSSRHD